jgi:hypothetical protein
LVNDRLRRSFSVVEVEVEEAGQQVVLQVVVRGAV